MEAGRAEELDQAIVNMRIVFLSRLLSERYGVQLNSSQLMRYGMNRPLDNVIKDVKADYRFQTLMFRLGRRLGKRAK